MDLMVGGIGATDTALSEKMGFATRDPNGEILEERVDMLHVGFDPLSSQPNLLDSRWVYRTKEYDIDEAEDLFNKKEEDFETNVAALDDNIDNFEYNPYGGIQDKIGYEWADARRRVARVHFYQWFDVEDFYRIENPLPSIASPNVAASLATAFLNVETPEDEEMFRFDPAADILVITKDNYSKVKDLFDIYDIPFDPVRAKRKVFYTAIISGSKVFDVYKSPSQQGYTIKFKVGDRDDVKKIYTGVVASLMDPQRYYNKALSELMLIIANNSRGGVMYEEDAVDNVREFEAKWALVNSAVKVNNGALSGGKIQPKGLPQQPTGYESIIALSGENMSAVTGIDESFFGAIVSGNETAMLQRQRIKQATTTLAVYFDSLDLYAKEQARLMLTYMRILADSSDGSLFSVNDDDGNVIFEVLSGDFFAEEYEIVIGEAPETPVQKEYYTQTLIGMAQSMQAIGDKRYLQMYAAAVKYMPIPNREKNQITEILIGSRQFTEEQVQQIIQPLQAQLQAFQSRGAQVQLSDAIADINKKNAETQKISEDIRKTEAETQKTYEEAEQKSLENDALLGSNNTNVNITI
jgi:hypothetical protein